MTLTPSPTSREEEDDDDVMEIEDEEEAQTHLPFAPSSELEDISTTVDPSYIISLIRKLVPHDVKEMKHSQKIEDNKHSYTEEEKGGILKDGKSGNSDITVIWDDYGCILWDLSASRTHAEFMVNNLLLDVLLANLNVSKSFRVIEICLGIIGNLACHDVFSEMIVSKSGLVETVVRQLFLDDSTCLAEALRLIGVGLQGTAFSCWAAALLQEQVLERILWIVGNTLNPLLLERGVEFLLKIVDNQDVALILLQPLTNSGLLNLVLGLLTCEISKLRDENKQERSSVLDMILRLVEALSAIDSYSKAFSSQEDLFHLVCGIVRSPDKMEMASSCTSAVVVIANLMADGQHLTSILSQDFNFLQGLFDVFPLVSDDPQARKALWCILTSLLAQVKKENISSFILQQFVSLFLEKFHLIKEDLEDHPMQDSGKDLCLAASVSHEMASSFEAMASILERWITQKSSTPKDDTEGRDYSVAVHKLLSYLRKPRVLAEGY